MAERLHLQRDGSDVIHLTAFGDPAHRTQQLDTATVDLIADNGEMIPIRVLIVPVISKPISIRYRQSISKLSYLKGLKLAHPVKEDDQFEISLLIGADSYWQIVGDDVIRGDGPTAVSSRIGYFLSGPLPAQSGDCNARIMDVIVTHVAEMDDLSQFWNIESMGVSAKECEDTEATTHLALYQEKCVTFEDGKYKAMLPWKQEHPPLPDNYAVAKKRTESTIRRLSKDPLLLQKYSEIIADQEKRGFVEKVNESLTPARMHYIPHHGVKKESATTPIRIVYDCSCRQATVSASLNDCLESTPPELNDLTALLMRFRVGKFGVTADIEKAFLNVALHEDDRDVTRFLWLSDPSDPDSQLITYRFKVVLFGATCSPFILSATLLKHITLNETNPAAHIIARDLYVDNVISSFYSEATLENYFRLARDLMTSGGFNLRSWASNSTKVREIAASDGVLDKDRVTKVLGLLWKPEADEMSFAVRSIEMTGTSTKRIILQQTAKIYDPLGMLSPVTVRAKLLVQDLWRKQFEWDAQLPADIMHSWEDLAGDLNIAMTTKFQRQYFPEGSPLQPDETTLHVFVDASARAYGAVAYLTSGSRSAFVFAKNRVAPVKTITLPRLELMAALVGARVANHVMTVITCKNVVCWSDSQIALHWIKSTKPLKRFVTNRVDEIRRLVPDTEWRYCPTQVNPADLQTRGITARQLSRSTLWQQGPDWLTDERQWPSWDGQLAVALTTIEGEDQDDEEATVHVQTSGAIEPSVLHAIPDITRFSSYCKLLRSTAYIFRFINNCRTAIASRRAGPLSVEEMRAAEIHLIRSSQIQTYSELFREMKKNDIRQSIIKQLRLYIDDDGCIRCGGRIHNADLPEETRFPYLLPAKNYLTTLIINDVHCRQLHTGISQTVTSIRQKFWIPSIRQRVRCVLRRCIVCRKVTGKSYSAPTPPPLPVDRVSGQPPFAVTGVDFTGALYVKEKTGSQQKVYICLFTCANTRAVHLEVVPDLTEESFMLAFRRFVSRRSLPRVMMSDNATTYQAAANHLRQLLASENLQASLTLRGTEWRFIPQRAPWYGGWWERLIGITKTTLKKILGKASVDLQTLQTVVTEVEAIINDRPLTYVSSSREDPEPLTPAHLLYGRAMTSLPFDQKASPEDNIGFRCAREDVTRRAQQHKRTIDHFWGRWKREYLTSLREYHRRSGNDRQSIRVGDVIQVQDDFTPRLQWNLARVEELITGNDGLVRAARIRNTKGLTTRAIVKLYPLEIPEAE
jgi:hypothetical protein